MTPRRLPLPAAAALSIGVLGAILLAVGFLVDPRRAAFAYLAAYVYVVTTVVGALILLMTFHAMHAAWPTVVRRLTESIAATVPLLALGFLPILFTLRRLYPWADPASVASAHDRAVLHHRAPWMNAPFFTARAVAYFAVWTLAALLLRRWSLAQDKMTAGEAIAQQARLRKLSAALLPAVGLSLSFASFDWVMALSPTWYSSMFGFYFFGGGFLAAIALVTVALYREQRAGTIAVANPSHFYALGRALLAFVIFWAYTAYFQLMLIWIADKPVEVRWYVDRFHAGWGTLGVVLVVVHFALPFVVLLNYQLKRRPHLLSAVAVWIIAAHYLDIHWNVMPAGYPEGLAIHWIDLAALAATVGLTVAFAAWQRAGHPVIAANDPDYPRAVRYASQ